jgi:hypothetical protein
MPLLSTIGGASASGFRPLGALGDTGFIEATGGTTADSGNYRYHTFNSSGTFSVTNAPSAKSIDYLVVAGGGGGYVGGGGGGGTLIVSGETVVRGSYAVTIGNVGNSNGSDVTNGGNSVFKSKTAIGGGAGGANSANGAAGGSGGGSGGTSRSGGAALQPTSMDGGYGNAGGNGGTSGTGGGGGAGGSSSGDTGGVGVSGSPLSSSLFGAGGDSFYGSAGSGTANTGNGGGGLDAPGGSGKVIIRYLFQ